MFDMTEGDSSVDSERRPHELPSGRRDGTARTSKGEHFEAVVAHVGSQKLVDIDLAMEKLLDTDLFEASGVERLGAGGALRCTLHGQGEDASDILSEEDCSHSVEKSEKYARFRTSPGPSRHLEPLLDLCSDPVPDQAMVEASQKAIR
eukprot:3114687-Pyramimonas_sp.AAC.1